MSGEHNLKYNCFGEFRQGPTLSCESLEKNPENEEDLNRLEDIENELTSKYKTREEGERIRSKLEKFENYEKPTKYFFTTI